MERLTKKNPDGSYTLVDPPFPYGVRDKETLINYIAGLENSRERYLESLESDIMRLENQIRMGQMGMCGPYSSYFNSFK